MRIALTSANFRPHIGGIERFTETLAEGLAARGHAVTVLCCRAERAPLSERIAGVEVVRVPSSYLLERALGVPYPLPGPALVRRLREVLARVDILHAQDALYATSAAGLLAARRRHVPSLLTLHVAFVPQRHAWLDLAQRAALASIGRDVRLASRVVALNPAVAEWAARAWRIEVPGVLPVGVDAPPPGLDRDAVRASFGLPSNRFLALFVGRDVAKKGLDVFLAAADPDYELVAVTDRPGPAAGGRLLPFMPPARLTELFGCVDAFVLPSEGEGFPLTLQEAFAAGLPAVTTLQPGYDHFLTPEDVMAVERNAPALRTALRRLVAEPELRARLAARSLDLARRRFGFAAFVEAYERLYGELVGRSEAS